MNKLFTQILEKRGLNEDFINPKYENLTPAEKMPDLEKAIKRIKKAVENNEKILIYGDYDVDGITSTALIDEALTLAGLKNIEIMLPDRFIDGYGMSKRLIERAKTEKIDLIITVDCGSRNFEIIDELNSLKIDTIVTDHHECEENLPAALAIINPKRKDFEGPKKLKDLAGVGVAFKLAEGLRDAGLIKNGQEKWLLDLVLIGTICDSMPLTGENRILGFYGVKVLEKTRRKGLIELMRKAGVKNITSESIGFQIGPRLNAAGRLESAELALSLLRAKTSTEAVKIADELEELNKSRRETQRTATDEIINRGEKIDPVIIESGNWHEGILGIVAGRLVEKYEKPAFVLTELEDGTLKGSGRSFGDFNLAAALEDAKDFIIKGGGHAAAAGVNLKKEDLPAFREKINAYYKSLKLSDQAYYLKKHPELYLENLSDLSLDFLDNLSLLEPFGIGNEAPLFCLENVNVLESRRMGKDNKHLRLDVKGKDKKSLKCVAFFAKEPWFNLNQDEPHNLLIEPVINEFNGIRSAEARLIDIL
ncbi:MAG: single-stranded-DNA-specific exonuclease RecJ [Candidatus Saccharibacteria bacterium]|nr:single-stranded-DNA-specific exonuclease RecJ [Candidatus Saccharibacteria bacterium]